MLWAGLPYSNSMTVIADRTHVVVAHTVPTQAFKYRRTYRGTWIA